MLTRDRRGDARQPERRLRDDLRAVRRRLGVAVNRKHVLRVVRECKLTPRRRPLERRNWPGFVRVERPRRLWQLDMTSVWIAGHGWDLPDGDHRLLLPRDRHLAA
jgi:hypothetical protein